MDCFHTDQYGEMCIQLKSDRFGQANVSALIENFTGGILINTTFWMYKNITFYQIPSSIEIKLDPQVSAPCEKANYPKCTSSIMKINATFRNSSGSPITPIPYVYFAIPKIGGDHPSSIMWWQHGLVDPWWWSSAWEKLIPSYVDYGDEPGGNCRSTLLTNNTCSATTDSTGTAHSNFTPTYPPGAYNLTVATYYRCDDEPYSPAVCELSVSNVTTMLDISPIQKRIIIDAPSQIKPDNRDKKTINATIYGRDNNPLEAVFYRAYVQPCDKTAGKCMMFKDMDNRRYWLTGQEGDIYSWYTNSSGRAALRMLHAIFPEITL